MNDFYEEGKFYEVTNRKIYFKFLKITKIINCGRGVRIYSCDLYCEDRTDTDIWYNYVDFDELNLVKMSKIKKLLLELK